MIGRDGRLGVAGVSSPKSVRCSANEESVQSPVAYFSKARVSSGARCSSSSTRLSRRPLSSYARMLVLCQEKVQIKYALLMLSYPAKASALSSNAA